jgi:two-component sensor histidine kinase
LMAAARRETSKPEQLAFLQHMEAKLRVVFEAQRLMYGGDSTKVDADQLLGSVAAITAALVTHNIKIDVEADPVAVSNDVAFPVALIINELLVNAVKYGVPSGVGRISASLRSVGADLELQIRDWGPGFVDVATSRRSSGLGLVRGLCRQIGGSLEIMSEGGVLVRIRFPKGD